MKEFFSNCLIEALKAKTRHPIKVKLKLIPSHFGINILPHLMWHDGINTYDFYTKDKLKWYQLILYKGYIRKKDCDYYDRCMLAIERKNIKNKMLLARKKLISKQITNFKRCSIIVISGKSNMEILRELCNKLSDKNLIKSHEILSAENIHTSLIAACANKRIDDWKYNMINREEIIIENFEYFSNKRCVQEELHSVFNEAKVPIIIASSCSVNSDNGFSAELVHFLKKGNTIT